jgi:hypothetical protein
MADSNTLRGDIAWALEWLDHCEELGWYSDHNRVIPSTYAKLVTLNGIEPVSDRYLMHTVAALRRHIAMIGLLNAATAGSA